MMDQSDHKELNARGISIVIPVCNRSHVLERAIQSCLNNSITPREIIIVDDYSKIEERARVLKIITKYPQAVFMDNGKRKGAQGARNTGAEAARGPWICFLDSDDYLLSDGIEKMLNTAEKAGVEVVHSECMVIREENFQLFGVPPMQGHIFSDILQRPAPMFQGMLIRKSALEKIGYLDDCIISYQEWDTAIRLAKYFEFAFVPEPTFVYDCRGSDTISKDMIRAVNGYKQVVLKHREEIIEYSGRSSMARHYKLIASQYSSLGIWNEYLKYLVKAILLQPLLAVGLMKRIAGSAKRLVVPHFARKA